MTAAAPRLLGPDGRALRLDPDLDAPLVGPSVFAVTPSSGGQDACNLWRVWQPFHQLQQHGYPAEWDWKANVATNLATASLAGRFTMHLVIRAGAMRHERQQMARWFRQMKDAGKVVVYECDDDLFTPFMTDQQTRRVPGSAPPKAQMEAERAACLWVLERCDGATVTTQHLASTVRRFTSAPVEVVPNAIDAPWFAATQALGERTVPGLTVGWAGGHRPDSDVEAMAEAWARLAARYPHVSFVVMGSQPAAIWERVPVHRLRPLPWLPVTEYPVGLLNIDIGCCPLEERPFNRCKSPIKAWEYALSGAAVVASPTVYRQVITHTTNGHLATTADEWEAALSTLVEDEEHRRFVAGNLKVDVLERWSLKKNYWRWPAAWNRLLHATTGS